MKKDSLLLALFVIAVPVFSAIKTVPAQYSTIQAAINASVNGDTILVSPGTYFENINFRGKNIVLTSTFYLNNDPSIIDATIINGSTPVHPDTVSCVIISNHEDSTAVLQGFTITGGRGTLWDDEHSPGNRFREGGGVLIQYSSPVVRNNVIKFNDAINDTGIAVSAGGGGIRMGDSNPKVMNNIVMGNRGLYGPGIVMNYSGGTFTNNIICMNTGGNSYSGGSGFWILGPFTSPKNIINNTIINNTAVIGSGGITLLSATADIRNNIIRGNTSPGNVQIQSPSLIYNNNIQGSYPGSGNIDADPMYADSNYILAPGSPCIDKGDSGLVYNDVEDPGNTGFARYPSRGGLRNDIGAYGGPNARVLTSQLIGINTPMTNTPNTFVLHQNYPNPFNPATQIKFELSGQGTVRLTVFDMTGKEVSVLINDSRPQGSYSVTFNAEGLSSGIYFYRLEAGNAAFTRKMMLIK
jgi:hypothetical protein